MHGAGVLVRGGADEIRVGDSEQLPQITENLFVPVDQLLRGDSGFFGGALDIDAVLVRTCEIGDVISAHAFVARNHIADDCGVGRADVRTRIRVIDRRGEIKLRLVR